MVDKLREVFELAQQRTAEEQNSIAELVERELDDHTREASDELRAAIKASNANYAAGEAIDVEGGRPPAPRTRASVIPSSCLKWMARPRKCG